MAVDINQEKYERYLGVLRKYLPNLESPDEKSFSMGEDRYSPNDLLHEVENRTDRGLRFIELLKDTEEKFGDLEAFFLEGKIKEGALEKPKTNFLERVLRDFRK